MLQRLRPRLSYANVMVTLLAFIVLGGGTALASYVISSNAQVGPNTISGHHPPTGDHANILAGSIASSDLAAGTGGQGYGSYHDGSQPVSQDGNPPTAPADDVLTKLLPAGKYLIIAKADVGGNDSSGFPPQVVCRTIAGGDYDEASWGLASGSGGSGLAMTVLHSSPTSFKVHLACDNAVHGPTDTVRYAKIAAVRLRSINNTSG
jgi:hypothetical protein